MIGLDRVVGAVIFWPVNATLRVLALIGDLRVQWHAR